MFVGAEENGRGQKMFPAPAVAAACLRAVSLELMRPDTHHTRLCEALVLM